jgi:hypothetical protein
VKRSPDVESLMVLWRAQGDLPPSVAKYLEGLKGLPYVSAALEAVEAGPPSRSAAEATVSGRPLLPIPGTPAPQTNEVSVRTALDPPHAVIQPGLRLTTRTAFHISLCWKSRECCVGGRGAGGRRHREREGGRKGKRGREGGRERKDSWKRGGGLSV